MKEKIVIISQYTTGGSLLYLQHLAKALKDKNYPVMFCLPAHTELGIKYKFSCKYILKEPSTSPAFLRVRLFKYLLHLVKYFYNALIIRPERHIRIAHILFPFYLTDFITVSRLRKAGAKVVLTVHEVFPHKPFLGGKTDIMIIKKLYEDSDLLLVHSDSLKNELTDLFSLPPEKVRVVPHGYFELPKSPADIISLKRKYQVPLDKKILLFFGTIRKNKGLDTLLDVMKEIKENYFLLITGQISGASEPSADHYREIIKANDIGESTNWVERYMTDEEAAEVFKIADAVVLPYKKTFHAQSGVLNLAIGYEKPCVVSDAGGLGETVNKYNIGVVVRPEDVRDLQRGIKNIIEGSVNFGFDKYKYDNRWDKVCDKLIIAYEELLAE